MNKKLTKLLSIFLIAGVIGTGAAFTLTACGDGDGDGTQTSQPGGEENNGSENNGSETPTPTPGGSETPTPTPGGSETPTPTPGGSETPTPTPGGSETPTPTPGGNDTPTPTPGGDDEKDPEETPAYVGTYKYIDVKDGGFVVDGTLTIEVKADGSYVYTEHGETAAEDISMDGEYEIVEDYIVIHGVDEEGEPYDRYATFDTKYKCLLIFDDLLDLDDITKCTDAYLNGDEVSAELANALEGYTGSGEKGPEEPEPEKEVDLTGWDSGYYIVEDSWDDNNYMFLNAENKTLKYQNTTCPIIDREDNVITYQYGDAGTYTITDNGDGTYSMKVSGDEGGTVGITLKKETAIYGKNFTLNQAQGVYKLASGAFSCPWYGTDKTYAFSTLSLYKDGTAIFDCGNMKYYAFYENYTAEEGFLVCGSCFRIRLVGDETGITGVKVLYNYDNANIRVSQVFALDKTATVAPLVGPAYIEHAPGRFYKDATTNHYIRTLKKMDQSVSLCWETSDNPVRFISGDEENGYLGYCLIPGETPVPTNYIFKPVPEPDYHITWEVYEVGEQTPFATCEFAMPDYDKLVADGETPIVTTKELDENGVGHFIVRKTGYYKFHSVGDDEQLKYSLKVYTQFDDYSGAPIIDKIIHYYKTDDVTNLASYQLVTESPWVYLEEDAEIGVSVNMSNTATYPVIVDYVEDLPSTPMDGNTVTIAAFDNDERYSYAWTAEEDGYVRITAPASAGFVFDDEEQDTVEKFGACITVNGVKYGWTSENYKWSYRGCVIHVTAGETYIIKLTCDDEWMSLGSVTLTIADATEDDLIFEGFAENKQGTYDFTCSKYTGVVTIKENSVVYTTVDDYGPWATTLPLIKVKGDGSYECFTDEWAEAPFIKISFIEGDKLHVQEIGVLDEEKATFDTDERVEPAVFEGFTADQRGTYVGADGTTVIIGEETIKYKVNEDSEMSDNLHVVLGAEDNTYIGQIYMAYNDSYVNDIVVVFNNGYITVTVSSSGIYNKNCDKQV